MRLAVIDLTIPAGRDELSRRVERLRASAAAEGDAAATVASVIADVREHGDAGVVRAMRRWTDPQFDGARIRVTAGELAAALDALEPRLRGALEASIDNVQRYQRHILPAPPRPVEIAGATLGLRFAPVASVGLHVPGGRAAYPSTVVMLAVPALVAGVPLARIAVATPPPTRRPGEPPRDVAPLVLATCALLGIGRVYRIGGAQAVAAMALGTAGVEPVDMVVGPGNVFSQLAKQQLAGRVGIDGFYGPSEVVTIADETADPRRVAADLIAQAEHDPGRCFLIAWSRGVIDAVGAAIEAQLPARTRREAIEAALREDAAAVLVRDPAGAAEAADALAAEHVSLAVAEPEALLARLRHGGEFFLGDAAPVAAGDYYAGPSHCLPTGTTARFASGVSVYTFLRRSGTVSYPDGMPSAAIDAVAALAEAEGLDGHAASARARR